MKGAWVSVNERNTKGVGGVNMDYNGGGLKMDYSGGGNDYGYYYG